MPFNPIKPGLLGDRVTLLEGSKDNPPLNVKARDKVKPGAEISAKIYCHVAAYFSVNGEQIGFKIHTI